MSSNGFRGRGRGGRGRGGDRGGRGRGGERGGSRGGRGGPRGGGGKPQQNRVITTKLFVGNLPETVRVSDLRHLFGEYGELAECDIVKDFAFVHYENEDDAKAAVDKLNGSEFQGSSISVEFSYSKVRQKPGMGDANECYRCGQSGHWSKDCPQSDGGGPVRRGRGGRGGRDESSRSYDTLPSRSYLRDDPYYRPLRPDPRDLYERDLYARDPYADRYLPPPSLSERYRRYDPYERRLLPPRDAYLRESLARLAADSDPYTRPPPDYYRSTRLEREPLDPYLSSRYPPPALPLRVTPPRRLPPPL